MIDMPYGAQGALSWTPALHEYLKSLDLTLVQILDYLKSPTAIVVQVFSLLTYLSVRFLGISPHEAVIYLWKLVTFSIRRLFGRSIFLLVTDADETGNVAATVTQRLQRDLKAEGFWWPRVIWLLNGDQMLHYPMFPFLVRGVILLVTDVTSLSNDPVRRTIVQKKMELFAQWGGCLVVSHDALYRRAKNQILQALAGGTILRFEAVPDEVEYQKCAEGPRMSANRALLQQLPSQMALGDNEVVYGNWEPGVEYLYVWRRENTKPLVTRRVVGRGVVFWCNTGDRDSHGPPPALVGADSQFIPLLAKLIAFR